jgi:hypothetical protein
VASFIRKPLKILDRIYGFVSAKTAVDAVDLASPIQLVHDVSREAESYSGMVGDSLDYGFITREDTIAAAGAGLNYSIAQVQIDVLNLSLGPNASPLDESKHDVWLMGQAFRSTAAFVNVYVWHHRQTPHLMGAASPNRELVYQSASCALTSAGGLYGAVGAPNAVPGSGMFVAPPRIIPWDDILYLSFQASAASTIIWSPIFWVGAKGSAPRGVA